MNRARTVVRFGILLATASLVACARSAPTVATPKPSNPLASCLTDAKAVSVLVTDEVDSATVLDFLALEPLGPCVMITQRRIPPADARDALDAGAATLITSEPAAHAYADTRADLYSTPLLWDRVYVLILDDSASALLPRSELALDSLRLELARDVVRGDARASTVAPCGHPIVTGARRLPRIGYASEHAVARSIAARLVAVAPRGDSLRIIAREDPVPDERDAATVMSFPVGDPALCERSGYVVPLVETRARAIVRVTQP